MAREDELAAKETFAQLKPVCVEVLRSLSVESLGRLDETLQGLHHLTSPLLEYVLFPLRMAIRRLGGSDKVLLEAVLSSLSLSLSRVPPSSLSLPWDVYQELFVFLSMLLDGRMSEEAGFGPPTEERTLRALMALQALLLSGSENSLFQLYQNLPAIGHCVSVTVGALQGWESRDLRKVSLSTLLALTGMKQVDIATFTECGTGDVYEDSGGSLKALRERVGRGERGKGKDDTALYIGEALASFLPGVTTTISKLLSTATNLGQDITILCLLVWARVVCLVMDDGVHQRDELVLSDVVKLVKNESLSDPLSDPPNVHTGTQSPSHAHGDHSLRVERSREWRVETDRRLSLLAHKMVAVLVAGDRSLVALAPILLETLLSLSHDGYQQVATAAQVSLELFSDQHAQEVGGELASVLEERLYSLASSLPRLMRQHDDVQKVSTLQLLAGFLQLLGPHTLTLTHSPAHLSRIIQALIQTLEVDPNDSHILQEIGPIDNQQGPTKNLSSPQGEGRNSDTKWWTLSLRYKHFRLPKVETRVQHCCQLLGHFGSLPSLLDHLLDLYRSSAQYRSELLIIIGHTLLGAGGRGCMAGREKPPHAVSGEELCALVEDVLEEVTGDGWRGGEHREGDTLSAADTLLQCLQLQVVSVCVRLLQSSFLPHLQRQAYLLLTRAGSPRPEVSSLAVDTLNIIATSTGDSSLAQLITTNADYLVNCVALTLRGHTHKREALQVLQAVLKHGAEEILPLIRDSLDELFLCLDLRMLDNEGVWSVLRSLAAALHHWSPKIASNGEDGREQAAGCDCGEREERGEEEDVTAAADVRRFFLDYHYHKDREEEAQEKEQSGEGGSSEGEGDTEDVGSRKTLSPVDKAAVDVLQRCPHFLPSSSSSFSPTTPPYLPLCVLDSLSDCLYALRLNQQALLPEVHKVWPSFVPRLNDHSPPVALRALEVLWDMCEVCGDFVRRRVVKGVWPVIAHSLTNLSSGSKHSGPTYRYTVTYKLQQKLLESVGVLPVKLQVTSTDLETLGHACLPYLSHYQPALLLETCKTSLAALIPVDPDVMWLLLHQLVPMETTSPPHPSLPPYKFVPLADGEEFVEAATALLQLTLAHS